MNDRPLNGSHTVHLGPAMVGAWLSFISIDFLLHAVVLAGWWRDTAEYWLPSAELAARIPFGYASFALYCLVLVWFLRKLHGDKPGIADGAKTGVAAGLIAGSVWVLGNYSVFDMPPMVFIIWPGGMTLESAAAGVAGSWILRAGNPWKRVAAVFGGSMLLIAVSIVLQNILFPTPLDHLVP